MRSSLRWHTLPHLDHIIEFYMLPSSTVAYTETNPHDQTVTVYKILARQDVDKAWDVLTALAGEAIDVSSFTMSWDDFDQYILRHIIRC